MLRPVTPENIVDYSSLNIRHPFSVLCLKKQTNKQTNHKKKDGFGLEKTCNIIFYVGCVYPFFEQDVQYTILEFRK